MPILNKENRTMDESLRTSVKFRDIGEGIYKTQESTNSRTQRDTHV